MSLCLSPSPGVGLFSFRRMREHPQISELRANESLSKSQIWIGHWRLRRQSQFSEVIFSISVCFTAIWCVGIGEIRVFRVPFLGNWKIFWLKVWIFGVLCYCFDRNFVTHLLTFFVYCWTLWGCLKVADLLSLHMQQSLILCVVRTSNIRVNNFCVYICHVCASLLIYVHSSWKILAFGAIGADNFTLRICQ